jgi:hypothetical protein
MNLLEFRKFFADRSGRHDLVDENYGDNGLDVIIFEAQKYLDRMDETRHSWATVFAPIALNGFSATFPHCRAIKEVWAASPTTGRWQLEKKKLQDIQAGYLGTLPSLMTSGVPLYYSPCITRTVPANDIMETYEQYFSYVSVASRDYNALIINVPSSEAISLIIEGLFYTPQAINDTDTNVWMTVHPILLYMSIMRQLDVMNRTTQGVNDWNNAIGQEMTQLGFDLVEEIVAEVDDMHG